MDLLRGSVKVLPWTPAELTTSSHTFTNSLGRARVPCLRRILLFTDCTILVDFVKAHAGAAGNFVANKNAARAPPRASRLIDFGAIAALDASYEATHKKSQVGSDSAYKYIVSYRILGPRSCARQGLHANGIHMSGDYRRQREVRRPKTARRACLPPAADRCGRSVRGRSSKS